MERLTIRNSDGSVSQPTATTIEAVFQRLAAYEDTGLSPEEIVPDKHGKWLPQILLGQRVWDCSECKTLGSPHWKRCPVCEAKMDLQDVTDINVGNKPVNDLYDEDGGDIYE